MGIMDNLGEQFLAPWKSLLQSAPYVGLTLLFAGAAFAFCYWYFYRSKLNITTIIFSKRGMPTVTTAGKIKKEPKEKKKETPIKRLFKLILTKSGYFKIKGDWYYKLKNPRTTVPCPDYEHLIPFKGGNLLFLRQESMDEFIPLKVRVEEKTAIFEAIPEDIKLWTTTMKDRMRAIYAKQTLWEKYGGLITIITAGAVVIILIAIVLNKFEVLQDVANKLVEVANILKSSSVTLPPTSPG